MPLPTRPPEWGMMRSPFLRMAAITATLVPCQSRRRCSRWSWAWKDLSWREVELRAGQGRGRGAAPAPDTPPEDRAQSQGHSRVFPRWGPAVPSSHLPFSGHHPDVEDAGLVPCLHHVVLDQLPGKEAGTRCHHKAAIQPCPHRGGGTWRAPRSARGPCVPVGTPAPGALGRTGPAGRAGSRAGRNPGPEGGRPPPPPPLPPPSAPAGSVPPRCQPAPGRDTEGDLTGDPHWGPGTLPPARWGRVALATGRPASHQQHVLLGTQQVGGVDEGRPCPPKVVGDDGVEAGGELLQAGGPGGLLLQRLLQLLQRLEAPRDLLLAQLPQRHLLHI